MSRAFVKEDDVHCFCRRKNRNCMYANWQWKCELDSCKYEVSGIQQGESAEKEDKL